MFQGILALLLLVSSDTFAQTLQVIVSKTKLSVPIHGMPVVYDGEDSIYVFGGSAATNGYQKDILKFDVTTEIVQKVGTMDPVAFGSAVLASNDSTLYFGGAYEGSLPQSKVWNYKLSGSSNWAQVSELPNRARYTSSLKVHGEYSYVFGGSSDSSFILNTISRYSSVTNTSTVVGKLPGPIEGTSAVWDETTGNAYIFGGNNLGEITKYIVKYNPEEDTVVTLNVTLPRVTHSPCAIWTGSEAYIIGGFSLNGVNLKIARFNPSSNEVLDIPVNNFPSHITYHGCAFVKKQNRIYIFGGWNANVTARRDEIMYIDLPSSSIIPNSNKNQD